MDLEIVSFKHSGQTNPLPFPSLGLSKGKNFYLLPVSEFGKLIYYELVAFSSLSSHSIYRSTIRPPGQNLVHFFAIAINVSVWSDLARVSP